MTKTGIKTRIFANLQVASQRNAWRAVTNACPHKNVISQQFLNILHTIFSDNQHLFHYVICEFDTTYFENVTMLSEGHIFCVSKRGHCYHCLCLVFYCQIIKRSHY